MFCVSVCSQSSVPLTTCATTRRGWSSVLAGRRATPTCRCAPGASRWRRATTSPSAWRASTPRGNSTCWRFLMVTKGKKQQHTHTICQKRSLHSLCFCFSSLVPVSSGPTANSPSLATLSGDLPTPFNLTTSSHQFLVRWSSDHGTNKKGFKIRYVGEYQSMYPNFIFTTINYIYIWSYCMAIKLVQKEGGVAETDRRQVGLCEWIIWSI